MSEGLGPVSAGKLSAGQLTLDEVGEKEGTHEHEGGWWAMHWGRAQEAALAGSHLSRPTAGQDGGRIAQHRRLSTVPFFCLLLATGAARRREEAGKAAS
jgi:hypothetical protein